MLALLCSIASVSLSLLHCCCHRKLSWYWHISAQQNIEIDVDPLKVSSINYFPPAPSLISSSPPPALTPPPPSPPFQAGSAHVRIRRDANEQLVLAHVTNRLLPLVSTLTVQIFKDDWTRPLLSGTLSSASVPPMSPAEGYALSSSSLPPLPMSSGGELDPLTSTPSKPTSPPPEFAFDTPGRNVQPMVLPAPGHHGHRPYGSLGLAYGASPYTGMLNHGLPRPGGGLGLGVQGLGAGYGLGVPSSQSYRTAYGGVPFGTSNPLASQSQYRQYRPWLYRTGTLTILWSTVEVQSLLGSDI